MDSTILTHMEHTFGGVDDHWQNLDKCSKESALANIKTQFPFSSDRRATRMEHLLGLVDDQHEQVLDGASVEHAVKWVDGRDEQFFNPRLRAEHTSSWMEEQKERLPYVEFAHTFSPDDVYQVGSNPTLCTRIRTGKSIPNAKEYQARLGRGLPLNSGSGARFLNKEQRMKIASLSLDDRERRSVEVEVLQDREERLARLEKYFSWAVHDPDALEVTADFMNALAGAVTTADDDAVRKRWWEGGLSLDLTLEVDKLKEMIRPSGMNHLNQSLRPDLFVSPKMPVLPDNSNLPAKCQHGKTNNDQCIACAKLWLEEYAPLYTNPVRAEESWERSHVRGFSPYDIVNGSVKTRLKEGVTQGVAWNPIQTIFKEGLGPCAGNSRENSSDGTDDSMTGLEANSTQGSATGHCPWNPIQPLFKEALGICLRDNSKESSTEEDSSEMDIDISDIEMEGWSETSADSDIEMEDADYTAE